MREIRLQLARLCAMVSNRWRPKGAEEVRDEDFLFQAPEAVLERSVEVEQAKKQHMISAFMALAAASDPRRPARPRRRKRPRR
jgi:hypothetical protein